MNEVFASPIALHASTRFMLPRANLPCAFICFDMNSDVHELATPRNHVDLSSFWIHSHKSFLAISYRAGHPSRTAPLYDHLGGSPIGDTPPVTTTNRSVFTSLRRLRSSISKGVCCFSTNSRSSQHIFLCSGYPLTDCRVDLMRRSPLQNGTLRPG